MSSSTNNLSKQLQELIKSIGETKSKQEEDRIILHELSTLKNRLNQKGNSSKKLKQLLIRALYVQMLGHSASFSHIEAINLTQSKNLLLKRIGYLLCSLFLNSKSDLTIMLISTIQKDLASSNVHQIVICLTCLDNIMNSTMSNAVQDAVIKLIDHNTDLVRKKAVLVLQKMKQVTGTPVPDYKNKMKKALCDRQPSVMAASLNLFLEQAKQNPRKYRDYAPNFVILLKQIIQHKLPKQFDYHRLPAPWIQMKLLQLVQILGKGDSKASQHCYTILQQTLRRAEDGSNNISFAVCYQCVKTICNIYPNESLIQQAASTLQRFLESYNANVKYMGIRGLGLIYKQQPELAENYQLFIVDCLQSKDQALKRQTLELLSRMTNNSNVEVIVSKMLNTLHYSTDLHFRNALVLKITSLIERYAPNHQWYMQKMCILFELGSQYLSDDVLNNFLKLVVENCEQNPDFGAQIIQKMVQLLNKIVPTDFIIKLAAWIMGQIGSNSGLIADPEPVFEHLVSLLQNECEKQNTKVWIIDAIIKISTVKSFNQHEQVKNILMNYSESFNIEICERCLQSKKMAKYNAALRLNHKLNFDEDLGFLNEYVSNAKLQGAKDYHKISVQQNFNQQLRFTPYEPKKINTPFGFQQQKKIYEQKTSPTLQITLPEVKPPMVSPTQQKQQRPKKPMITPEQKARKNLANTLFSGAGKAKGPSFKGPQKAQTPATLPTKKQEDQSLI